MNKIIDAEAEMILRPANPTDLFDVLALNNQAVPAVNPLEIADLEWFAEVAHTFLVGELERRIEGFLIGLEGAGLAYPSANYRWFSSRYDRFLYVDRVVVAPSAFGRGMGQAFYRSFVNQATDHPVLCAEVNTRPRNERSLDFHAAFGFEPVGSQDTEGDTKTVQMLAVDLAAFNKE
ncbi:MAG: GNAT family N-acetyltransferase [Acidimicrobiales bacterium]|nr:GNAT family N-acetyltransferase [Acidimicrobiales bacterium]